LNMKLAILIERLDFARGGAERSTLEMARCLAEEGAEVSLFAGHVKGGSEETPQQKVQIYSLDIHALTRAGWWKRLEQQAARTIRDKDFDLVHSMAPVGWADVYQPRQGSLLTNARRHAESYAGALRRGLKRATAGCNLARGARIRSERRLCADPQGPIVAAVSDYVAEQFRTDYSLAEHRLRIIRNGIVPDAFGSAATREDALRLRRRMDPKDELAIFIFAAENLRLKGLGPLLQAARIAMQRRTDSRRDFRILVLSHSDYTRYWPVVRRLGLKGRVLFPGGTARMPAMLAMADAVVLPTAHDACSRIILEGLAAGRPGITTRNNGAAEFFAGGKYGIAIPGAEDADLLAEAMLTLCDRDRHAAMCRAIQQDRVAEQVSMRRHAKELISLYEEILRRKKPVSP